MRDIDRIDPLLMKIKCAWMLSPDMRLGQLLTNAIGLEDPKHYSLGTRMRLIEDDKLVDLIDRFTERRTSVIDKTIEGDLSR